MGIRGILICIALALGLTGLSRAGEPVHSFGVLNQQSAQLTAERWNPMLSYVSEKTGVPLQLKMGPTVQDTDDMMGRGEFDFMFTNHNFMPEYDKVGYRVIARWAGEPIRCTFVVPKHSPISTLKDLRGKRIAFPSQDAFVAYAVPTALLRRQGLKYDEVFAGNQDGALAQVKFERVDAAAVNSRFLAQYQVQHGIEFKVIHESEDYPELPIVVHPRVKAEVVAKVRQAFLDMKRDPAAVSTLARAKSLGFDPASDQDYAQVRSVYRAIAR